ncbi:MAG: adenylosuccinate synthase [Myxococcota bacterium]
MRTMVVVGAQWGDEGKGKVVDVLSERADVVARFGGGNNAGHTLVVDGKQIITHLVPSGCLYPGTTCLLGAGMVIDPDVFAEEVRELQQLGLLRQDELRVSLDAHLILPVFRELDGLREDASRKGAIGTTRRGIGPTYEAKVGRRGVRVRDVLDEGRLARRLERLLPWVAGELARLGVADDEVRRLSDGDAMMAAAKPWAQWLAPMACDAGALCTRAVADGKRVLFEGAQGAMLDVDHGTYPYVTSSSTIAGGVCTGLGLGPTLIDDVWGITKAYTTRVGAGPFPTKLEGAAGDALRAAGSEYGATTGRPRDCGWLDLPALRYAARLNGMTGLCVTKLDVLAQLPEVGICEAYEDGRTPGTDELEGVVPRLRTLRGWGDPSVAAGLLAAKTREDLPAPVRAYVDLIEEATEVPVVMLGVGAERAQTVMLAEAFAPPTDA